MEEKLTQIRYGLTVLETIMDVICYEIKLAGISARNSVLIYVNDYQSSSRDFVFTNGGLFFFYFWGNDEKSVRKEFEKTLQNESRTNVPKL